MNKACIIIDNLKEMMVSLKWIMETKGTVNLVQDVYTSGWSTIMKHQQLRIHLSPWHSTSEQTMARRSHQLMSNNTTVAIVAEGSRNIWKL